MTTVFLVPGFFGFDRIGALNYFQRVSSVLAEQLSARGLEAEVIEVATQPTSSIRRRAIRLLQLVKQRKLGESEDVHFVGHSTGGLDVRLLLTPGVQLERSTAEEYLGDHTRSVVTLATPHFGTPLANFFTSLNGRNFLYLLTLLATSAPGRMMTYAAAQALVQTSRFGGRVGLRHKTLAHYVDNLLGEVRMAGDDPLHEFLQSVASDQGAMVQLTPESIDLFNAAVPNRPGVEYVSFVTAVPPPRLRFPTKLNTYDLTTGALFRAAYEISSREHRHYPYPHPGPGEEAKIRAALSFPLTPRTNDGIVPTLSQIWTRLGGVAIGDHLDVVGQFPHDHGGTHYPGWLHSSAAFDETAFQALWSAIAEEIATASRSAG